MQGENALLNIVTIPPGATISSARLVLDGVRGAIFVYAAGGALVGSWASTAGVDPYGNVYPAGLDVAQGSITGTVFQGVSWQLNQNGLFFYSTPTPAQVQSQNSGNQNYSGSSTTTIGPMTATSVGNTVALIIQYTRNSGNWTNGLTSVKLTQSNTQMTRIAKVGCYLNASQSPSFVELWVSTNTPGGDTQMTLTFGDSFNVISYARSMQEYSGLGPTPQIDLNTTAGSQSGTTSNWSVSGPSTSAVELLLAAVGAVDAATSTAPTITGPGAPWTNTAQQGGHVDAITASDGMVAGFQVTSAAGTQTYSGTFSAAQNYGAFLASINPSGGTTLIGGWAVNAGQDSHGNAYPAGLFMIGGGQSIEQYSSSPPGATNLVASMSGTARSDGFGNNLIAGITSIVHLMKSQASAPSANAGGALLWASSNGAPEVTRPSGITPTAIPAEVYSSGNPQFTVGNNATLTNVSPILTIPANDAVANSRYEIEIVGFGQAGATTIEGMTFSISINGTAFTTVPIGVVLFGAVSQTFSFTCRAILHVITGGSSGTAHGHMTGVIANTTANHGGSTQATLDGAGSTNAAFNTTISNTMVINFQWGGAGGAGQVLNVAASVVRRMGPLCLSLISPGAGVGTRHGRSGHGMLLEDGQDQLGGVDVAIYSQINVFSIQSNVRALLGTLYDVMVQLQAEQGKFAAFSAADLEAAGLLAADYNFLASALADANGLANILFTGTDPRNPGAGYVYANSIKQILGA